MINKKMLYFLLLAFVFCASEMRFTRPTSHHIRVLPKPHEITKMLNEGFMKDFSPGVLIAPPHLVEQLPHYEHEVLVESGFEGYPSHDELLAHIDQIVGDHPEWFSTFSIGKSKQKRDLRVLRFSGAPNGEHTRPVMRLIGNIHGDEVVGREILMDFADKIAKHESIRDEYAGLDIEILPSMNPDGFTLGIRESLEGDLNRAFPDKYSGVHWNAEYAPVEVLAVMDWFRDGKAVAVASMHGGTVICNYPRDGNANHTEHYCENVEDKELVKHVCDAYVEYNSEMRNSLLWGGKVCGGQWYLVYGGLQDYIYDTYKIPSVTIEVSFNKTPSYEFIHSKYVPENIGSLIHLSMRGKQGLDLRLQSIHGQSISGTVSVGVGSVWTCDGACFRMLKPGFYTVEVTSDHGTASTSIEIDDNRTTSLTLVI